MRKFVFVFTITLLFLFGKAGEIQAQGYVIDKFSSEIVIGSDDSIDVTERIEVNYSESRHGIYRFIPVLYESDNKKVRLGVNVKSVTDGSGKRWNYETSRSGNNLEIKIGDAEAYVQGRNVYVIDYVVDGVIQPYDGHDELYWNVVGDGWDTSIGNVSARVYSSEAKITKWKCFSGRSGSQEEKCISSKSGDSEVNFDSTSNLGAGADMTVVVGFEQGVIGYPGQISKLWDRIFYNWGYIVSPLAFLMFGYLWFKKGRDRVFVGDNIYYEEEGREVHSEPVFARKFLPMVYSPIAGLTPSEVGVLADEKVDIHDIVAEIVELARLGFLKIHKLDKDTLFGSKTEYAFEKLKESNTELASYQDMILEEIFSDDYVDVSMKHLEKVYKKDSAEYKDLIKKVGVGKFVFLSSMQNKFYKSLDKIKKDLYKSVSESGLFEGDPERVRTKWIAIFIVVEVVEIAVLIFFAQFTGNFLPVVIAGILTVPAIFFAIFMPRRSPKGHSLYRQVEGLKYYLGRGKWRHEIAEKHLFLEEMLPLAISLGVVKKFAKDMEKLGVEPPKYFSGINNAALYSAISSFDTTASSSMAPKSGGGGWSGGSGFSGGSGGGFGGGGGGSW